MIITLENPTVDWFWPCVRWPLCDPPLVLRPPTDHSHLPYVYYLAERKTNLLTKRHCQLCWRLGVNLSSDLPPPTSSPSAHPPPPLHPHPPGPTECLILAGIVCECEKGGQRSPHAPSFRSSLAAAHLHWSSEGVGRWRLSWGFDSYWSDPNLFLPPRNRATTPESDEDITPMLRC